MRVKSLAQLPKEHLCLTCKVTKPIADMIVIRERRTGSIILRSRCKTCHNERERGHRREWKRKYLKTWRKHHPELNESYWRQSNEQNREMISARAAERFRKHHEALLIQGRLCRRGVKVSIEEARAFYKKYGQCYPSRYGLTPAGVRECERIRASQRRLPKDKRFSCLEIRMMVYEDGYYIKPSRQLVPYKSAAEKLRQWQAQRRQGSSRRVA